MGMREDGIYVVSLFDGMSCGRIALERLGIKVKAYYASEIDKYAMQVAKKNWPDIVHIGNVLNVRVKDLPIIPDLLLGGSPCQGFSRAGKGLNFDDPRSKLFFEYLRILKECKEVNPNVKFLLENVEMDRWCEGIITEQLGVHPLKINSALVSAQNRERLYWTNIGPGWSDLAGTRVSEIPQPKDRGIVLKDIIEEGAVDREKSYCIDANYWKGGGLENYLDKGRRQLVFRGGAIRRMANNLEIRDDEKANSLLSDGHQSRIVVIGKDPTVKFEHTSRVHSPAGKSPCLMVGKGGGNRQGSQDGRE